MAAAVAIDTQRLIRKSCLLQPRAQSADFPIPSGRRGSFLRYRPSRQFCRQLHKIRSVSVADLLRKLRVEKCQSGGFPRRKADFEGRLATPGFDNPQIPERQRLEVTPMFPEVQEKQKFKRLHPLLDDKLLQQILG